MSTNPPPNGSISSGPQQNTTIPERSVQGQPLYQSYQGPSQPPQYQSYGQSQYSGAPPMFQSHGNYPSYQSQPSVGIQQRVASQQNVYDISYIQSNIEQYLQFYYTDDEIVRELEKKAVQRDTTLYILTKLKEQNPGYFKAYEFRLALKSQISRYNEIIQLYLATSAQQEQIPIQPQQPITQQYPKDVYSDYNGGSYISGPYGGDQSVGM
ncbi:hypothetical protein EDI_190490 [Entamoeba dispar SAW760]|uniref:Uncharacterized protein n=1 Tax=Entamoeba dispar (strain ATCC PRA-260 / SAW760) TaxID=370354 RepID=B0E617_ENTDS|nr:uncharacterized protein EDI_190490 [Entamoeba dispar SAW760]EDR29990.1 hypothetical protein EDI_190490 [Entamoeba dispar SAW760]|eukprot:EDR29990.1 hypothetical protein EDI_190490 [Entamoeba dispar SAW760]